MMRLPSYLVLAVSLMGCFATTPPGVARAPTQNTTQADDPCGGLLRPVAGGEIAEIIVGAQLSFTGIKGVCPQSIWITSNWGIDFKTSGEAWLQGDRAGRNGTYTIKGDELCISSNRGGGCHQLYRDEAGRFYLAGAEVPGPEPAMVTIKR